MTTTALVFWAFWAACITGVTGLLLLVYRIRRGQWWWAGITTCIIATNATTAILLWQTDGPCLLPHPSMIEYHPGMTLCPGQSTMITIEVPADDQHQRGL